MTEVVVSSLLIGGFFGSIIGGPLNDKVSQWNWLESCAKFKHIIEFMLIWNFTEKSLSDGQEEDCHFGFYSIYFGFVIDVCFAYNHYILASIRKNYCWDCNWNCSLHSSDVFSRIVPSRYLQFLTDFLFFCAICLALFHFCGTFFDEIFLEFRGALVSINELFVTVGVFMSFVVDFGLSSSGSGNWRWMLGLAIVPAVVQLLGMSYLPESPR